MSLIPKVNWLSHIATMLASTQPITAAILRAFHIDILDSFVHKNDLPISGTPTTGDTLQFNGTNWVPVSPSTANGATTVKVGSASSSVYIQHASFIGSTDNWSVFVDSIYKGTYNSGFGLDIATGRISITNLEVGQTWIAFKVI